MNRNVRGSYRLCASLVGAFDTVVASLIDPIVTRYGYDPQDGADALDPSHGWRHGKATSVTRETGATALHITHDQSEAFAFSANY